MPRMKMCPECGHPWGGYFNPFVSLARMMKIPVRPWCGIDDPEAPNDDVSGWGQGGACSCRNVCHVGARAQARRAAS